MDEQRQDPALSTLPAQQNSGGGHTTDAQTPVSSYGLAQNMYPIEDLEVHQPGSGGVVTPSYQSLPMDTKPGKGLLSFSRRKAMVVSVAITIVVTLLTGASILVINRHAPKSQQASQTTIKQQDITLKNAAITSLPSELQGSASSLLVNGDLITRGDLKFSNGNYVTLFRTQDVSADQTFTLPNASGTLCLDSNNCSFASSSQLAATTAQLAKLQQTLGQIAQSPTIVTTLNNQSGALSIQGSLNQISVNTVGGVVTLSTPQNLDANANVQFGNLLTSTGGSVKTNNLQQTAAGSNVSINAGSDAITFTAGGESFQFPVGGGASQTICTTGISCAAGGGQAVILGPASAQANNTANPSIFINTTGGGKLLQLQSVGVDKLVVTNSGDTTISGSLTVAGLGSGPVRSTGGLLSVGAIGLASSDVTGVLGVTNGGTGTNTLASHGVLVGNGVGAVTSVTAGSAGQCLVSTAAAPSFQSCPGITSLDSMGGSVSIQGTTNQVTVTDGAGTITLSTPQDINNAASPTFAGLTLSGLSNGVVKVTGGVLSGGTVTLGTDTSGSYVASLGSLTGLTTSGNSGAGSTPTLTVQYGSAANTAVQGNTQLTCTGVTGSNLSGGGNAVTLGAASPSCNNISLSATPTFTSVTAPSFTGVGAVGLSSGGVADLTLTSGSGTINVGATTLKGTASQTIDLTNAANTVLTVTNSGAGSADLNIAKGGLQTAGTVRLTNGGVLQNITGLTVTSGGATISGTTTLSSLSTGIVHANSSGQLSSSAVALGSEVNGTLLAANGGTGIASYTIGDLLYADSTSTLAKLPDVGAGSCLVSGGSGIAPSWQSCAGAGSGVTLQAAYNNSAASPTPEIQLDSTRKGLVIQDAASSVGGNLFEVSSSGGGTKYLAVSTAGLTTSGTLTIQGATATVGTSSLQGNLVLNAGNGQAATLQTSPSLGQATTYTLPDTGQATATICLKYGASLSNCSGSGGGVTTLGGTINRSVIFDGSQDIADGWLFQNGSTLQLDATKGLSLLGGDLNVTGNGTFTGTLSANNFSGTVNGITLSDAGTSQFTISGGSPTARTLTVKTNDVSLDQNLLMASNVSFNQLTLTGSPLTIGSGGTGLNITNPTSGDLLIGNGSGYSLNPLTSDGTVVITTPSAGHIQLSVPSAGACSSCANSSLSNLVSPAIQGAGSTPVSLAAGLAGEDLGTNAQAFRSLYLYGSGTYGADGVKLTVAAGSGNDIITLPATNGTVALVQTAGSAVIQSGDISIDSSFIGPNFKTQDTSAGSTNSQALSIRSGSASGATSNSGNITIDAGTATQLKGAITLAGTNASALTLGRTGLQVQLPGGLSTGGSDIVSGGGNLNLTAGTITSGAVNLQTIGAASTFTGTVAIQGANALTLGTSSATGSILFNNQSGSNAVTLKASNSNPASSFSITLPSSLPGATSCVTLDNTGQLGTTGCSSGLGGSGANNDIPVFTGGGTSLTNSIISQDTTTNPTDPVLTVLGDISVGNAAQGRGLGLYDSTGSGNLAVLIAGSGASGPLTQNYVLNLPTTLDTTGKCLVVDGSGSNGQLDYGNCAAGGTGGNITAAGVSTNNHLTRFTNNGASYTASASLVQDDGTDVGINIAPQSGSILTVGSSNAFKVTDAGAVTAAGLTTTGLIQGSVAGQALTLSGAPAASLTNSLVQLGGILSTGNNVSHGGTYLGINEPAAGSNGSVADFLDFQNNNTKKLVVDNGGNFTTAGTYNGVTISGSSSIAVSGASTINQNVSTTGNPGFTGVTLTNALGIAYGGTGNLITGLTSSNKGAVLMYDSTQGKFVPNRLTSTGGSLTYTYGDGTTDIAVNSCTTCANTALSNLSSPALLGAGSTAVNLAAGKAGESLGTQTQAFNSLFLYGSGTYGTDGIKLTAASGSGSNVITFPASGGTVCVNTGNNCGYQLAGSYVSLSPGSPDGGFINITGNAQAATFNNLTLTQNADGFQLAGGSTSSRTLVVTGSNVALNQNLRTTDDVTFNSIVNTTTLSVGSTSTYTGAATFNGGVAIGANQPLTINTGTGVLTQGYTTGPAGSSASAQVINLTNNNTGGGIALQGTSFTPSNTSTPSSGSNILNVVNFAAASAPTGSNTTNGIKFASSTGYTNFIQTPSFNLSNTGAITGVTTINTSGLITSVGVTSGSGLIQGTGGLTVGGAIKFSSLTAGLVTSDASGNITQVASINRDTSSFLTGTLSAGNGGTGQSTYTIGDILYASAATTLSKLTDVATGSCLISGGAGVAPSWGSCVSGNNLQTAYNNSTGGTTPEIIVNTGSDATGVDIQNNNSSPIADNLFAVRKGAASGLGNLIFDVYNSGAASSVGINLGTTNVPTGDLSFGNGAARLVNVIQASSGVGNNLSVVAGQGAVGSAGGNLLLQAGANGTATQTPGSVIVQANGGNSTTAMQIQTSGGVAIFNADTNNSRITIGINGNGTPASTSPALLVTSAEFQGALYIGTSAGNIQNNGTGGALRYNGTAQNVKQIVLTPEYAGAAFNADGTNNIGSMTDGYDSSQFENYYQWTTSQGTAQDYDIVVSIPIPADWAGWSSTAIGIDDKATAGGTVTATVLGVNGTADSSCNAQVLTIATTWPSTPRTDCNLGGTGASYTYTAGKANAITLRLHISAAASGGTTQVGNIVLSYKSQF